MARYEELLVDQGSTFRYELSIFDAAGSKFNLENHTLSMQVRRNYTSDTVALTPTLTQEDGVITIRMSDEQTLTLTEKRYVYDVYIEGPDEKKHRVLEGNLVVTPTVTQFS